MPCDTRTYTAPQRKKAIEELDKKIAAGAVKVVADKVRGKLTLSKWTGASERAGFADSCAVTALRARGSWATKQAINKALAELTPAQRQEIESHGHSHG